MHLIQNSRKTRTHQTHSINGIVWIRKKSFQGRSLTFVPRYLFQRMNLVNGASHRMYIDGESFKQEGEFVNHGIQAKMFEFFLKILSTNFQSITYIVKL